MVECSDGSDERSDCRKLYKLTDTCTYSGSMYVCMYARIVWANHTYM